jgi:hypothetical protein
LGIVEGTLHGDGSSLCRDTHYKENKSLYFLKLMS